ncbi:MAG TPA: phosphoribosylaminoimidazolesuccinocarboxamide synthase [Fimbriimonadaceae bacterium]|nr:phosphoribosylaminoimidazolesuccinocarboxamide synthase [Fimbriimonadaceae bacterium]HRJ32583.1 phosphoribosylaminoimidazolesuccinocarboxamide synthase [Fimbriimonadaceae bacterium]
MSALMSMPIAHLPPPRVGKVREVFDLGDAVLIVATDRLSAYDVVMANGVPGKGILLNQLSAFWFDMFRDVCPNHVLSTDDRVIAEYVGTEEPRLRRRSTLARKARPLPIECVARGYITGSIYADYRREGPKVHGLSLPEGLVDGDRLPEVLFTPATKAQEGHDENLSWDQAVDLVGSETADQVRSWTLALYQRAAAYAEARGILLADTKFEFGETPDGLIWIDEALTPDSSRFWDAASYAPGQAQPSFDKQYVRDYLTSIGWDRRPPGPELPTEVIRATRQKYQEAYERLVGTRCELDADPL